MPGSVSLPSGAPLTTRDALLLQRAIGNRAVSQLVGPRRRIQRRTAEPERSDKTRTFTYSLELYTVDDESYQEAKAVAATLSAFAPKVTDFMTQQPYTVRFKISVHAPPKPEALEAAFGIDLHYRGGRKRLRPARARAAAERWWVDKMRQPGNTGNLYLGNHPPSKEAKAFITDVAKGTGTSAEQAILQETKSRFDQAKSPADRQAASDYYHQELHALHENPPEEAAQAGLDEPHPGSKGTTFSGVVTQIRAPGGPQQYQHNIRVHEIMHLLGLNVDHHDNRPSVMSYPHVGRNKTKRLLPSADDITQLVEVDNPPSMNSVD